MLIKCLVNVETKKIKSKIIFILAYIDLDTDEGK
jgi:hypothetical protein